MKGKMQDGSSNSSHIFLDLLQYTTNGGKNPNQTNQQIKETTSPLQL